MRRMSSVPPPITPEQIAVLPPEFRALLQAVIDDYEPRIAALEAEVVAFKALGLTDLLGDCLVAVQ